MMVERALNRNALPVKRGQLMLRTECGLCGAEFVSPTKAANHLRKMHQTPSLARKTASYDY